MAEFTDALTEKHIACIAKQPVFFTATAAADGRINLSPKGYADSFRILSDTQVAYLDLGGSGNETHAHLAADGRITVMFCAFDRGALILRIYGRGRPVLPPDTEWDALAGRSTPLPGPRQSFWSHVTTGRPRPMPTVSAFSPIPKAPISTSADRGTRRTRTSPRTAASRSCSAPSFAAR